jgi:hypothetical protein
MGVDSIRSLTTKDTKVHKTNTFIGSGFAFVLLRVLCGFGFGQQSKIPSRPAHIFADLFFERINRGKLDFRPPPFQE